MQEDVENQVVITTKDPLDADYKWTPAVKCPSCGELIPKEGDIGD